MLLVEGNKQHVEGNCWCKRGLSTASCVSVYLQRLHRAMSVTFAVQAASVYTTGSCATVRMTAATRAMNSSAVCVFLSFTQSRQHQLFTVIVLYTTRNTSGDEIAKREWYKPDRAIQSTCSLFVFIVLHVAYCSMWIVKLKYINMCSVKSSLTWIHTGFNAVAGQCNKPIKTIIRRAFDRGASRRPLDGLTLTITITITMTITLSFHLIFVTGRGIVMDYPCAKFGYFSFSCFGLVVQTDRHTDRQTESQMRMIAILTQLPSAWGNRKMRVEGGVMWMSDGPIHQARWLDSRDAYTLHVVRNDWETRLDSEARFPFKRKSYAIACVSCGFCLRTQRKRLRLNGNRASLRSISGFNQLRVYRHW